MPRYSTLLLVALLTVALTGGPAAAQPGSESGFPVTFRSSGQMDWSELNRRLQKHVFTEGMLERHPKLEKLQRFFSWSQQYGIDSYRWRMNLSGGQMYLRASADASEVEQDSPTAEMLELGGAPLDLINRLNTGELLGYMSVAHPVEQGFIALRSAREMSKKMPSDGEKQQELEQMRQGLKMLMSQLQKVGGEQGLKRVIGDQLDLIAFPSESSEGPVGGAALIQIDDRPALEGWLALLSERFGFSLQEPLFESQGFTVYELQGPRPMALGISDSELFLTNDHEKLLELYFSEERAPAIPPVELTSRTVINLRQIKRTFMQDKSPLDLESGKPYGEVLAAMRHVLGMDAERLGTVRIESSVEDRSFVTTATANSNALSALIYGAAVAGARKELSGEDESKPSPGGAGYQNRQHKRNLDQLVESLNSYREQHGKYPRSLSELSASHQLPNNPVSGRPIKQVERSNFSPGDAVYLTGDRRRSAYVFIFGERKDGGMDVFTDGAGWKDYPRPVGTDGNPDGVVAWESLGHED